MASTFWHDIGPGLPWPDLRSNIEINPPEISNLVYIDASRRDGHDGGKIIKASYLDKKLFKTIFLMEYNNFQRNPLGAEKAGRYKT